MIKLGDQVRDCYTKFEGIATARTEYLYGCTRITIEPTKLVDGKPVDAQWFDEQRVELIKSRARIDHSGGAVQTGGPMPPPRRIPDPKR